MLKQNKVIYTLLLFTVLLFSFFTVSLLILEIIITYLLSVTSHFGSCGLEAANVLHLLLRSFIFVT